MVRTAISCIALAGCLGGPVGPPVLGSPSDVTTAAGSYAGYRVTTTCPQTFAQIGVIGTGSVAVTEVADVAHAGDELSAQLTDIASIWGRGGYGLVCEHVGTSIALDDWRDVDAVIARTGAFLQARDLALEVGIRVASMPSPNAE